MTAKSAEPLTGQAAYEAQKREIAKRNEQAYARGREQREEQDAKALARRRSAEDRDLEQLPTQPSPD